MLVGAQIWLAGWSQPPLRLHSGLSQGKIDDVRDTKCADHDVGGFKLTINHTGICRGVNEQRGERNTTPMIVVDSDDPLGDPEFHFS